MNICKHCKHYKLADDYAMCGESVKLERDLVSGDYGYEGYASCYERRLNPEDSCGPNGKLYEYKPPKYVPNDIPYFMWTAKL